MVDLFSFAGHVTSDAGKHELKIVRFSGIEVHVYVFVHKVSAESLA